MRITPNISLPEGNVTAKAIVDRDRKLAAAINANDIEVVTSAPSAAPEYPAPALRLYKNGSTWQLYIYVDDTDGWKYVNLT